MNSNTIHRISECNCTMDASVQSWTLSYPDGIIIADRDQNVEDRVPLHHLDVLRVACQHRGTLELVPWQHLPYPHRLVPAARGEQRPGRAPRHALHLVLVPLHAQSTEVNIHPQQGNQLVATPILILVKLSKLNSSVATHSKSPPLYSHTAVVASKLAVASSFPLGDQAQDLTVRLCVSSSTSCPNQADGRN